jgi:hypothetical protein
VGDGGPDRAALVKFWPLVRPQDRAYFGMHLSLSIQGYFYALLKRGALDLWDQQSPQAT